MHSTPRWLSNFVVILAAFGSGCDDRPAIDSSMTEATVTGTILIKGKPASGGEITFNPANVDRLVAPRSATIDKDGTYTIKTYTGGNQIGFGGSVTSQNPGLFRFKQYFEVQRGENKKDFDLLSDSQAADGATYSNPKGNALIKETQGGGNTSRKYGNGSK